MTHSNLIKLKKLYLRNFEFVSHLKVKQITITTVMKVDFESKENIFACNVKMIIKITCFQAKICSRKLQQSLPITIPV